MKPKIRLYLDARKPDAENLCPVYIKITHIGTTAYIVTDIRILASEWNAQAEAVTKNINKTAFNHYLSALVEKYRDRIDEIILSQDISRKRAADIKKLLTARPKEDRLLFWNRFQEYTAKMSASSQRMFNQTADRIKEYDKHYEKLLFEDITTEWLERFEKHLKDERNNQHNTIIWHLQHIRTVLNDAISDGLLSVSPFHKFHSLASHAAKRAIEPAELRNILQKTDFDHQDSLDLFKLSFYLIGMNMVDILHLPHDVIVDGRIVYVRQKLHYKHKEISIKVEPEALEIINKYRGKKYLLRFLEDEENKPKYRKNPEKLVDAHAAIVRRVDNHLKKVRKKLATYYARHSWATIAINHCDISMDFIAQSLGHSSAHKTTNIYITHGSRKVDEANRKVIDYVLGIVDDGQKHGK